MSYQCTMYTHTYALTVEHLLTPGVCFTDNAEEFQEEFKNQPAMFERLEGRGIY